MKRLVKSLLSLLIFIGVGTGLSQGQTTGSVSLTATLSDTGSGPEHWTVVWVTNATTGAYVRTLRRQANESRSSHWNQHCGSWYAAASLATSATNFNPAPDGFTGATATSYSVPNSPFTQTWNCKDATGATVPDGTYRLWIQYAEDAGGQGPVTTGGLLWTKGPAASTVNPANQGTNFTNMSIVWTPTGVTAAPEIAVEQPVGTNIADAGSKAFGSVVVGSGTPLTFTIRNTGTADLTGLSITKDGTHANDFTVTSAPIAPVAGPSGTTTFIVTFLPSAVGARNAALHIANNDSDEAPFDINLSGVGLAAAAPEIAVEQPVGTNIADAGSKAFGSVVVGSGTPLTFTIRNTGTADLTGLTITKDGTHANDFTVTSAPIAPVAGPSGTTTFIVTFSPSAVGARNAALHIANNDSDEAPFDINLSGVGLAAAAPEIAVEQPVGTNIADAGSKAFGSVVVGSGTPLTFTIRNTGAADLTGLTITKDGTHASDFIVTSAPIAPVAGPSGTTTFIVTFSPSAVGARNAALHIANNDSDEAPFDINLAGTGVAVIEAPSIVTHPVSLGIVSGQTAMLSVLATGTTPVYQWYRGTSGDTSSPVSGADGLSFTTPALTAAASYWVRVSNSAGAADSDAASVTISSYVLATSAVHGAISGAGVYGAAAQATLTATPDAGYVFSGWTGDATGITNPLTVVMDSNKNIGATFSLDPTNPTDPFVICFVGTLFEPRVGNAITLDLKRLAGAGETIKLTGNLPSGLSYNSSTGLISGIITAKPGTYRLIVRILQGKTVVKTIDLPITVLPFPSSLAGDYEGILEDESGIPTGVFHVLITSTNRWTATLESVGAKKRTAKGVCSLASGLPVVDVSAVFKGSSGVPAVTVALSIDGTSPNISGTSGIGALRGFRLANASDVLPSAVACNLVFDAGSQDGITVPAGFGWMKGNVRMSGSGSFSGLLGDGTSVRVSLRLSSAGQAVFWAQPYSNKQSFIGGIVSLGNLGQASGDDDKLTETLWWSKSADAKTQSYPNGFAAMPISLGTSRWIVPSTAEELGASLGWRDNRTASVTIEGAGFESEDSESSFALPQEFTMDDSFNLRSSSFASWARNDDDDDDDDDDDKKTQLELRSGKVSRTYGTFSGFFKIPSGGDGGIAGGNADLSGVLLQDESLGEVTGFGLVKVPIEGKKNAFRTAAIILEK